MRTMTTDTAEQTEQFPLQPGNMPFVAITSPLRHDTSAPGPQTIHYQVQVESTDLFFIFFADFGGKSAEWI